MLTHMVNKNSHENCTLLKIFAKYFSCMGFLCRIDIGPMTLVKNIYAISIKMLGQIEAINGSPSSLLSLLFQSKPFKNFPILERLDVVTVFQFSSKGGIIPALRCVILFHKLFHICFKCWHHLLSTKTMFPSLSKQLCTEHQQKETH